MERDRKWVVAYGLRGEGLVWLIGAVVCLLAALHVQLFISAFSLLTGAVMHDKANDGVAYAIWASTKYVKALSGVG